MTLVQRRLRRLCSFVLLWFVASLGVAIASPVVHPQAVELVCSGTSIKAVVHTDEGAHELGVSHMDCPLCFLTGTPPRTTVVALPVILPLAHAVLPVPAAHIAAATAAPLPARGPPAFL
jgi:hypothetical protein